MRLRPILPAILGLVAGCGPWVITPETPTPSASPSEPAFADERALLVDQFDLDPQAFVPTADGPHSQAPVRCLASRRRPGPMSRCH